MNNATSPRNRLRHLLHALALALITALGLVTAGCSDSSDSPSTPGPEPTPPPPPPEDVTAFSATLHRTDGGIPHIVAEDWASLGYGTGYAAAEDHYCAQARNILKFRAQLSEFLGPDGGNRNSDLFFQLMIDTGLYDEVIDPEFDALFAGYAAGFNRYTRDRGDAVTDPACAGASWIPEVTAQDIRRIHLTPAFLPNVGFLMVQAIPPASVAASTASDDATQAVALAQRPPWRSSVTPARSAELAALMEEIGRDHGSNGVAIGRELSSSGNGLLFTNPHLGWDDFTFRMYGFHQIIPGVSNLLGANQAQRANVGFGTNGEVAWTNTVSDGLFFSFYEHELVPGNPLQYVFDGEVRDIEPVTVSIRELNDDGSVSDHEHTFYRSHHGWFVGGGILPWTETEGFAVRPADEGARGFQGGALAMARATNVRELKAVIEQYGNFPSTNVIAADSSGEVLVGDLAPAPYLSDEQLEACATSSTGQRILGNTSACEWMIDENAAAPGLLPPDMMPSIIRSDYGTNSNNSAWLSNPEQPIEPILRIKGDTRTERSMRTRSGLMMVQARQAGTDGLPGNTFDLDSLQERMLSNQAPAAQLLLDGLLEACRANPTVSLESGDVDLTEACDVLAAWDRSYNLDSRGAHVFREFLRGMITDGSNVPESIAVTMPFDADNPVATPAGFDPDNNAESLVSLAQAVQLFTDAGVALDTPLGDLQGVTLNGERIPLHGGDQFEGGFNKMGMALRGSEYPAVTGSSASWIMVTEVAGDNTRARGLTAYSQSTDPTSENYSNLTKRFSTKDLPEIPFLLGDVEAQALSTVQLDEGTADCAGDAWQAFAGQGATDEASCRAWFQAAFESRITGFVDD